MESKEATLTKMDERLRQMEISMARMETAHDALGDVVQEIKNNHLAHLSADVKNLAEDFKVFQKADLDSHDALNKKIDKLSIRLAAIGGGIAVLATLLQLAARFIK